MMTVVLKLWLSSTRAEFLATLPFSDLTFPRFYLKEHLLSRSSGRNVLGQPSLEVEN